MKMLQIAVAASLAFVLFAVVGVFMRRFLKSLYFAYYDSVRQEILLEIEVGFEPERILKGDWSVLRRTRARAFDDLLMALAGGQAALGRGAVEQFELAQRLMRSSGRVQHHLALLAKLSPPSELMRSATLLGALGLIEGLHPLGKLLSHPRPELKAAALQALERIGLPEAEPYLHRVAPEVTRKGENRLLIRAMIACCRGTPHALVRWLTDPAASVRLAAATALAETAAPQIAPSLLPFARDPDPEVRARLADALAACVSASGKAVGAAEVLAGILELARDPVWFVRVRALDALARMPRQNYIPRILECLRDPHWQVRQKAAHALRSVRGGTIGLKQLSEHLRELDDNYGRAALVTDLEYCGIIWDAVNQLEEKSGPRVKEALEFLQTLAELGFQGAARYALEHHPVALVRSRLKRLLETPLETVENSPSSLT